MVSGLLSGDFVLKSDERKNTREVRRYNLILTERCIRIHKPSVTQALNFREAEISSPEISS